MAVKTTPIKTIAPTPKATTSPSMNKSVVSAPAKTIAIWWKSVDATKLASLVSALQKKWVSNSTILSKINGGMTPASSAATPATTKAVSSFSTSNKNMGSTTTQQTPEQKRVWEAYTAVKAGIPTASEMKKTQQAATEKAAALDKMRGNVDTELLPPASDVMQAFKDKQWISEKNTPDFNRTTTKTPAQVEQDKLNIWASFGNKILWDKATELATTAYKKLVDAGKSPEEAKKMITDKLVTGWYKTDTLSFPWEAELTTDKAVTNLEDLLWENKDATTADLTKANEAAIEGAAWLNKIAWSFDEDKLTQLTNRIDSLQDYIKNATDPETGQLAQIASERLGNIEWAKAEMINNANLMKDSQDRITRLQSNEALQSIMRQYMAKGMTEEEARWQASSDINAQVMKERQVLLQSAADSANLQNSVVQWAANAKDAISQAKENNVKYDVWLEQTITWMYNDAVANKYDSLKNNFASYVWTTWMQAFNDLRDVEKEEVMKMLDINLADKDKRYAAMTFLTSIGSALWTNPKLAAELVSKITGGELTLEQGIANMYAGKSWTTGATWTAWTGGSWKSTPASVPATPSSTATTNADTAIKKILADPLKSREQKMQMFTDWIGKINADITLTAEEKKTIASKLQAQLDALKKWNEQYMTPAPNMSTPASNWYSTPAITWTPIIPNSQAAAWTSGGIDRSAVDTAWNKTYTIPDWSKTVANIMANTLEWWQEKYNRIKQAVMDNKKLYDQISNDQGMRPSSKEEALANIKKQNDIMMQSPLYRQYYLQ